MEHLLCRPHERGTVTDSHHVGYTSVDLWWTVIVLATQTRIGNCLNVYYMIKLFKDLFILHCIPFRILCFIRNLRYMESKFIFTVFIWFPQFDNWIKHQFFNLHLWHQHVHGTHIYTFNYIYTHKATETKSQRTKTLWGLSLTISATCQY